MQTRQLSTKSYLVMYLAMFIYEETLLNIGGSRPRDTSQTDRVTLIRLITICQWPLSAEKRHRQIKRQGRHPSSFSGCHNPLSCSLDHHPCSSSAVSATPTACLKMATIPRMRGSADILFQRPWFRSVIFFVNSLNIVAFRKRLWLSWALRMELLKTVIRLQT